MRVPKETIRKRMKEFQESSRRLGIKITHQRLEVYREVASTGEHPDAGTVYQRVRKRMPTISVDTVYRNLRLLEEQGMLSIVGMSHEHLWFDANMSPHHHFACSKCAKIRDFAADVSNQAALCDKARGWGEPVSLYFEVRGICRECQGG